MILEKHPVWQSGQGIVISHLADGFFHLYALNNQPQLGSNCRNKANQPLVFGARFKNKKYYYGNNRVIGKDRDCHRRLQTMFPGKGRTRKVCINGNIPYPHRLLR